MKRYDLIIVGAGPAGLSAAIEAAKKGLHVVVFDENLRPGGQLFKQIHKFFGSKEHQAKVRGFNIGKKLLAEATQLGVEVQLNATVTGMYLDKEVIVKKGDEIFHFKGDAIIVATGASENSVPFKGWTLPGVIGAGAAQTMMNLHGIKPGKKILMLGSGNVGLVVSFQLLQAGCDVVAIVDAAPHIGGYGVHAAKVARCGVPFYLSHTIQSVSGDEKVEKVVIGAVDSSFTLIPETEKTFTVDTICVAVGLSPMSQLFKMAGCKMDDNPKKGGQVPVCNEWGETSIKGIFAAGDVAGIEEASSAMIEGKMAGVCASEYLGYCSSAEQAKDLENMAKDLDSLRQGMFAIKNRGKKIETTMEGIPISTNLLKKGFLSDADIKRFSPTKKIAGVHPVIECTQNIPCNPCQDACVRHCIKIGKDITALPVVDTTKTCMGCGLCVAACSGQAIFLVNEDFSSDYALITLPYEFLPLPQKGEKGKATTRSGEILCDAEVISVKTSKAYDHTALLTMKVPLAMSEKARFFKKVKSYA